MKARGNRNRLFELRSSRSLFFSSDRALLNLPHCAEVSFKKPPEHLRAIAREQSRASWDYADALCAVLPGLVQELREDGKLSMYELQLRSQVQRETTSKLEAKMRLPNFHALARIAFVLAGSFE